MLKDLHHFEFGAADQLMETSAFKTYPLAFAFSTEIVTMISASVAKGLTQQQILFVIAVEVNCGISQADARTELEADRWDYVEAMVNIRCEQQSPRGYSSNWPGQPANYGAASA